MKLFLILKNIFSYVFRALNYCLVKFALFLIKIYKLFLSPYLGNNCRFSPTCSVYSKDALLKYGFLKGCYLSTIRILKCNPWGGSGLDPLK
jgi:putative membrane protein insertion efficiency factor